MIGAERPSGLPVQFIGERLLTTLWVGALWAIGYLAVPTLFANLQDRIQAGMLAGHMFTALSYIGLLCAALLLLGELSRHGRAVTGRVRFWLLVGMALLVAVGEFWLQPMMAALKAGGLPAGSADEAAFMRLHGIAAILYLINSLAGVLLVSLDGVRRSG